MGVPAFFRWLSRKYPSVIVYCVEEKPKVINGFKIPVDSSKINPNGTEFDNLYLDMNGIIHPCTHPEDKPPPKDEDEMMMAIFECIDRIFSIVRPRKLLYMAIDGVAPRAKMNQQRSRRFRSSKESVEKIEEVARLRQELLNKGALLPPEMPKEAHFDSNCITPGTAFMARLSVCLDYYIQEKLNNDPGWKSIKVILSDANVPGEGEHKIMDFIRKQRAQPDHDPNTQHVLCGADADLIMLGLATHEPNFTIIREEFRPNKAKPCDVCQQMGHEMKDCTGLASAMDGGQGTMVTEELPFIFVRLSVLREYLERELTMPNLPFEYDFERVVDDWVFMCFFVGNDFLPHLPSLEIREGAIDRLVNLYKKCVYKTGGFVTNSGDINLNRVELILSELGKVEDEIFKKRQETDLMFKRRDIARKRMAMLNRNEKPAWIPGGQFNPSALGGGSRPQAIQDPRHAAYQGRVETLQGRAGLEALMKPEGSRREKKKRGFKRRFDEEDSDEDVPDEVRLWEEGFKDRYYESKFEVAKDDLNFRTKVAHEYVRGLCWVLRYYYQGCASWKWFFPYHYAPFASDFINIGNLLTTFEKGTQPFKPLEQLMGVFPSASSDHVPKPWAALMHDPSSPIIDFYPIDFKIDLNGKKFAWQGVALLPFVDEKRLIKTLELNYDKLTPEEKQRNIRGDDRLYLGPLNIGYNYLKGLYEPPTFVTDQEFDFCVEGMRGKVLLSVEYLCSREIVPSPIRSLPPIIDNVAACARFRDLTYPPDFIFSARKLEGAIEPQRVLKPEDLDLEESRDWVPFTGMVLPTQRGSLSSAGHRMLGHYSNTTQNPSGGFTQTRGRGIYSQVPPPPMPRPMFPQFNYRPNPNQAYGYFTAANNSQRGSHSNNSRAHYHTPNRDPRGFNPRNQNQMGQNRRGGFNNRHNNRGRDGWNDRGGGIARKYHSQRGYRR